MSGDNQIQKGDESFPSQYDPKSFEDKIYSQWEQARAFHSQPNPNKKPYTIPIPPPNVTGVLHIGHALNNTLQDILIRWRRMQGFETLWMPGTDHAGIATQNVVEKQIAATEKKNRYQVGRAELIKRIWQWKEQSGGTILKQLRKLGATCDWERTRFTMDEGLSKAVRHAFVRLYEDGLIYRGKYLVNWCPRCRTTLSDDEVEHEDIKGKFYQIHYPFVGTPPAPATPSESGEPYYVSGKNCLTVATTRPETLLGDTAVAVHPDDERYKPFVGKMVELPLTGRKIPVIADSALELGFGTGCLKVTPAHDPVDYQIGQRHKLPLINIFTENGLINENSPEKYRGQDRFKARTQVVEDLKAQGLLGEVKDHPQQVGHCYRCHTIVEPYLTSQWYVKMKPLSELAVKATAEGRVKFHPDRWAKVYLKWFDDVRDWPISRQIWWGHQIPVWYDLEANAGSITTIEAGPDEPYDLEKDGKRYRYIIGEHAKPIVSKEDPTNLPEYKGRTLLRDPDVLDTWFSSGLWPFSTLGWPDQTPELKYYYPTSTLVTSRGIIYFWVARMVMLGEKMMGREPFSDVVIHGTVLDGEGEVMSKSKGNGIDPLDIIARYGADAMRFTLADMSTGGQDLKFPVQIACPHCDESQELPKKRKEPVMVCKKCKKEFQQPIPNATTPPLPEPAMGPLDSPRFEKGRNFANKVWNAARYVICTAGVPPASQSSNEAPEIRGRGYLPHLLRAGGTYHVVFRLYGTLPKQIFDQWQAKRDAILNNPAKTSDDKNAAKQAFAEQINNYLDTSTGDCWLKQALIAKVVQDALKYFDKQRYELHAWTIMPNHVHVVVTPREGHALSDILHSWKSYTSKQIAGLLPHSVNEFWQPEYYDHLVRDEDEFHRTCAYVENNPVAAGLCTDAAQWTFSSASDPERRQLPHNGGRDARDTLELRDEDRWILSRLNTTVNEVTVALDGFEFSKAIGTLYDFFWNEFCSWYIELTKPRLSASAPISERHAAKAVLLYTLDRSLRMLHPFCPYVSEALWAELESRSNSAERNLGKNEYEGANKRQDIQGGLLIVTPWPKAEAEYINTELEASFASMFESVVAIRAVRQELIDNSPKERKKEVSAALANPFKVVIRTKDAAMAQRLKSQAHILKQMANIEAPEIGNELPPPKLASATGIKGATIYVALTQDLLDVERTRLGKEIGKAEQFIPKIESKLKNENFVKNAPPELVAEERTKLKEVQEKLGSLKAALANLG